MQAQGAGFLMATARGREGEREAERDKLARAQLSACS